MEIIFLRNFKEIWKNYWNKFAQNGKNILVKIMKKADKMSEYAGTNRDIKGLTNRNPGGIMSGKKCGSCLAHAEIPEPGS